MSKRTTSGETDFPRGGVKLNKRTQQDYDRDLFQTDVHVETKKKFDQYQPKPEKTKKVQQKFQMVKVDKPSKQCECESLKFQFVHVGMSVLGCVSKVGDYSVKMDLPGGLTGEISITNISSTYTQLLRRITADDDEDYDEEQPIAHLNDMMKPGLILPCVVTAMKIRTGSRKKIYLSIDPCLVNKELSVTDVKEGMVLLGSVESVEDHGYIIDLGIRELKSFLSQKQCETFISDINQGQSLNVGQVLRVCVLSINNRSVKLTAKPERLEKAQLTVEKNFDVKGTAGVTVKGKVKEVLPQGLVVAFLGHTGYVHQTHTPKYQLKKHYSKGDEVTATVLYVLPGGVISLSLLPHLRGVSCSEQRADYEALIDGRVHHEASVLDPLTTAVYFKLGGKIRALATHAHLSAIKISDEPLSKIFPVGQKHRCSIIGYNLVENVVHIRLEGPNENKDMDVSPNLKRKMENIQEEIRSGSKKKKKNSEEDAIQKYTKDSETKVLVNVSIDKSVDIDSSKKKSKKHKHIDSIQEIEMSDDAMKGCKIDTLKHEGETEIRDEKKKKKLKGKQEIVEGTKIKDVNTCESVIAVTDSMGSKSRNVKQIQKEVPLNCKKSESMVKKSEESDSGVEMNKASDSDDNEDMKIPRVGSNPPRLPSIGFTWKQELSAPQTCEPDDSSDSDVEDTKPEAKTRQELRQERKDEEKKIYDYEMQRLAGDQTPMTTDDFDRLVLQSPDSSMVWTRYMAFHLETVEIEKARAVAERALKTISFREEQEKLNMWVAYLNLENMYGSETQLSAVFDRAVQQNEPSKVYKQLVQIYANSGKMEEAEKTYNTMARKFSQDKTVWTGFALFFFKNKRLEAARKLLQRCLKSLENRDHVDMISKFAQLEYKHGEFQRGCTMFENILTNYPKRTDLWSVYLDMVIKTGNTTDIRSLFERVIHMKMSSKKIQFFFKKYLDFEKKYGDAASVEKVKQKAVDYVECHMDTS